MVIVRFVMRITFLLVAVVLLACPSFASAFTQSDVHIEFKSSEINRLLCKTASYADCDFILHDMSTKNDTFLRVRSEYRLRYDVLVGDDAVNILGSDADVSVQSEHASNPLVEIEDARVKPWCDMLKLSMMRLGDDGKYEVRQGSAFMISGKVGVTAAHCVYRDGAFHDVIQGASGCNPGRIGISWSTPSKIVIQREWADKAVKGASDGDLDAGHDFAVMFFDKKPQGVEGAQFSLESISIVDSLSVLVCNAGYAPKSDGVTRAWKSRLGQYISTLDLSGPGGNNFQTRLSLISGMSGGPVYRDVDSGRLTVVGINSWEMLGLSYSCRITERLQVLVAWANVKGFERISTGGGSSSTSPSTGGSAYAMLLRD